MFVVIMPTWQHYVNFQLHIFVQLSEKIGKIKDWQAISWGVVLRLDKYWQFNFTIILLKPYKFN